MTSEYDVIIAGGGVAGCTAALALRHSHTLNIAIIETSPPHQSDIRPAVDARVIALAGESLSYLAAWGADITNVSSCDIKRIHVSDRKHIGQTVLDVKDVKSSQTDALGKVVRLEELGLALFDNIKQLTASKGKGTQHTVISGKIKNKGHIDYYTPESIETLSRTVSKVVLNTQKRTLEAKLLVIAEGANSATRDMLGIESTSVDYKQSAVIANVVMQLPHNNCAYERFTKYGPVALLPMQDEGNNNKDSGKSTLMSLVWTVPSARATDIAALSDAAFMKELSTLFGTRLGRIKSAAPRHVYPLVLKQCKDFATHRCICIGNAAQSLHPIAGQGFNLGVRDIDDLKNAIEDTQDAGKYSVIARYRALRKQDKQAVITATDSLVRGFSNHYLPFVFGRTKALSMLNFVPPLKDKFARFAMGERDAQHAKD